MKKVGWIWRRHLPLATWAGVLVMLFLVSDCFSEETPAARKTLKGISLQEQTDTSPALQLLVQNDQVVMDNGLVQITLSNPGGVVTGIRYNGIDNLLATKNQENDRGYWDINGNWAGNNNAIASRLEGTDFKVIMQNENQIEVSFTSSWQASLGGSGIPLIVDKRYILLRGSSGFYNYAIFERLQGWPDLDIDQIRSVFKLDEDKFHFMAISDDRQRIMPMPQDFENGKPLDFPEAVLLTHPSNPMFRGEVDDKYQYSCENKDIWVHGWMSFDPLVGFWLITPSNEFRSGGPIKQSLTSHVGPTTLSSFASLHYAGKDMEMQFRNGEPWKKVFGPVFVYLNSVPLNQNPHLLWEDAKQQMLKQVESWPYSFPLSDDFPSSDQRGTVSGQLLFHDGYINVNNMAGRFAYVGLASPGEAGSWQRESKGYQFWVQADTEGHFSVKNIRSGIYYLYAWVPGVIGDYRYNVVVTVTPGSDINLGVLVYEAPRDGVTLWEIGIPDRSAAEFYIPDPYPTLTNPLYNNHSDKFRQYGLWERYTDLYPEQDLIYKVGVSNYQSDWFFAHVNRDIGKNSYKATTWQILFELQNLSNLGLYKLRLALASATVAELQVRLNNPDQNPPHYTTGIIGDDNAIARHGIHGLYWLFSIDVESSHLQNGWNTIFLTQTKTEGPFRGLMYDYIRLEGPRDMSLNYPLVTSMGSGGSRGYASMWLYTITIIIAFFSL